MSSSATPVPLDDSPNDTLFKLAILIPSIISLTSSLILTIVMVTYRSRQTTLSKFVFSMALSDLVYAFMGIFFTFDRYFQKCPTFLSTTRQYTRMVSCGLAIVFALTTSLLAKTGKTDPGKNFVHKSFMAVLVSPLIFVLFFILLFPHEYLDLLCWYDTETEEPNSDTARHILEFPLVMTFIITFGIYSFLIIYIKRKMAREGNIKLSGNLYELLLYPLGVFVCYVWFFLENFHEPKSPIRTVDIIGQQLQGTINFVIYGMNYHTRTQMKDYWNRIRNRFHEFLHLQEKEKEKDKEFEMQSVPLLTEHNTTYDNKYQHTLH